MSVKARVKSADKAFADDYMEIEAGQGDEIQFQIAIRIDTHKRQYNHIVVEREALQKALKRAGIEVVS